MDNNAIRKLFFAKSRKERAETGGRELYFIRDVYGLHENETSATGNSVLASHWLTGRGNKIHAAQTTPLYIATVGR
jgi:hypothetical protein